MKAEQRLEELLAGLQKLRSRPVVSSMPAAITAPLPVTAAATASDLGRQASLAALSALLREFAGFRPTGHLLRKLDQVLRGMDGEQLAALIASLRADTSRRELQAMVEDLTNHETYFFRDPQQLDVLANTLLPALVQQKARGDRSLRLWSAGCATGEEAWTLAMLALQALLDAGHAREPRPGEIELASGWRLEVMGTDISRAALRIARDAAYSDNTLASFRQFPTPYERFFERTAGNFSRYRRINDALRRHVSFEPFNLLGNTPPRLQCDLVLCRNVLIYLDPAAQPEIQRMLRDALRPGGYLMLGVVDRLWRRDDFVEHWYGRTVIHERK